MKKTRTVIEICINRSFFALLAIVLIGLFSSCSSFRNNVSSAFENNIITMDEWGGTQAIDSLAKKHIVNRITLHHQGEPFPAGRNPVEYLRALQKWSRTEKHWIDLPYHYIIDLNGKVYEGRKINYAGDSNTEYNPTGHALIEVVGNFEEVEPNQLQLDAVVNTMTWLAIKYNVSVDSIRSHKDYSSKTVCPGKNLYRFFENGYFREKVKNNLSN